MSRRFGTVPFISGMFVISCATIPEFNHTDQCVVCGMSVETEMLCDGKTKRILVNASEMFTKTFPQSAPSLADENGRAATAGDAVNQTRGQTSEGVCNKYVILWPQKIIHVQYTQTESIRLRHFTIRLDSHGVEPHYRKSRSVK